MFADQISGVAKANLEAQIAAANEFGAKAFAGVAQLVELNLRAAKSSLEESSAAASQVMSIKDPKELLDLISSQGQPTAEKALAYSRNLAAIAAAAQAELARSAQEQADARTRQANALIDELSKNAPPGFEQAISLLKQTMSNASAGYEQINKLTKQANESFEENFGKVMNQFVPAAQKTAGKRK